MSVLFHAGKFIFNAGSSVYTQVSNKSESEDLYIVVVPSLKQRLTQGEPFNSEGFQRDLEALLLLPPTGARRLNFEKRYLVNEHTLRELPDDPEKLSIAYWW